MKNVLIIKTGAAGDVVRTTVLLHLFTHNVYWITASEHVGLFPDEHPGLTIINKDSIPGSLKEIIFDLVINLEEDLMLAGMVNDLSKQRIIGIFVENDNLKYTPESQEWFDMSLISRFPQAVADQLKKENKKSFQEILFGMFSKFFLSEPYVIYKPLNTKKNLKLIGIEERSGPRWPNKNWYGYKELAELLKKEGYEVCFFSQRKNIREYLSDIVNCNLVVCGDSLAMHVAIACNIPCVAIFNCTSPDEIFNYGFLKKVVSPLLSENYYSREKREDVIRSLPVSLIYSEVIKMSS